MTSTEMVPIGTSVESLAHEEMIPEGLVRMVTPLGPAHTLDGLHCTTGSILRMMDIATCASAEKHSGVNCVTVAVGDVVLEYVPMAGEVLEIVAEPVLVGNTSIEIAVTCTAEFGSERRVVCEAFFTYVTTRSATGEKRKVPPLPAYSSERWASKRAAHRKALLAVEGKTAASPPASPTSMTQGAKEQQQQQQQRLEEEELEEERVAAGPAYFECSEVVLPAHQNHMGHTFGGVVMDWMCNAALACGSRYARCSAGSLVILGVHRVSFPSGSDVSDHLVFRAQVNAVFDGGDAAEVEVRAFKKSINTGDETAINVGYFTLNVLQPIRAVGNGWLRKGRGRALPERGRRRRTFGWCLGGGFGGFGGGGGSVVVSLKFPLQSSKRRSGEDPKSVSSSSSSSSVNRRSMWRRRLHVARRQLLTNRGGVLEWHPALASEASRVTIDAARRLLLSGRTNVGDSSSRGSSGENSGSSSSESEESVGEDAGGAPQWRSIRDAERRAISSLNAALLRREEEDGAAIGGGGGGGGGAAAGEKESGGGGGGGAQISLEWASGSHWGRASTFVLRAAVRALPVRGVGISGEAAVKAALGAIKDNRQVWDARCAGVDTLEASSQTLKAHNEDQALPGGESEKGGRSQSGGGDDVFWDIVEHQVRHTAKARLLRCCLWPLTHLRSSCHRASEEEGGGGGGGGGGERGGRGNAAGCGAVERLVLLRAWQFEKASGSAAADRPSQLSPTPQTHVAWFASRSVIHPKARATTVVLPSLWKISSPTPVAATADDQGQLSIEYAIEFEFDTLRRALPGFSDTQIVRIIAHMVGQWFANLPDAISAYHRTTIPA